MMGKKIKRWVAWLLIGWMICLCGCQGRGYMGGLGGVLSQDFRQSSFSVCVRGEICRTAADGYTPPHMTPMAGMGVSMKDTPLSFAADVWADMPVGNTQIRNFSVKYTAPSALAGVEVACRVTPSETEGTWNARYTLSLSLQTQGDDVLTFDVTYDQVAGLLRPLTALLPQGDVTQASKAKDGSAEVVISHEGGVCTLHFDTNTQAHLPVSVKWQDEYGWVQMSVTQKPA